MSITQSTSNPARLWIVRHGQTDYNVQGRIQGHMKTTLNPTGIAQAQLLARYLADKPFSAVYSSDLPRALQTAQIIAQPLNLPITTTLELRERHLGPFEGKTASEIHATLPTHSTSPNQGDLANWTNVPGVESDDAVWLRASSILQKIASAHPGQDVLIVTHGGVLARIIYHTLGIASTHPRRFPLSNGITLILTCHNETFRLLSLVDMPLLFDHQHHPDTASAPTKN